MVLPRSQPHHPSLAELIPRLHGQVTCSRLSQALVPANFPHWGIIWIFSCSHSLPVLPGSFPNAHLCGRACFTSGKEGWFSRHPLPHPRQRMSAEGRAWCCPFLRTSWQVLGYQQTQASEPEQQMWQQDAKPAAPSGPEHSQPEAAPGGSGFSTDKQHIKVAAPATASPWGLAQMGQPCLSVVFCSLCLLQPLFFCRDTRQILSSAFLSFIAPRPDSSVPHCSPGCSLGVVAAGLSRSPEPLEAAVHKPRFWAPVTARGAL